MPFSSPTVSSPIATAAAVSRAFRARSLVSLVTALAVVAAVVGVTLVTSSTPAHADTANSWDQVSLFKNGSPVFAYGASSPDFPYPGQIFDAYDAELADVNSLVQSYAPEVNTLIQNEAASNGYGALDPHLNSLAATVVDSDLTLSFTGNGQGTNGDGEVAVNFTLPVIQLYVRVNAALGTSATVVVNVGPAQGSVVYDVDTGVPTDASLSSVPVSLVSANVNSGPYLGDIVSLLLANVIDPLTGLPLDAPPFVLTPLLNRILTNVLQNFVEGYSNVAALISFGTKTFPTVFGLDNVFNFLGQKIPSNVMIDGESVPKYLSDAINDNLNGTLVTITVGSYDTGTQTIPGIYDSGLIGSPWYGGTYPTDALDITVSGYELQVVDASRGAPLQDGDTSLTLGLWEQCQLGLLSSATCSQAQSLSGTLQGQVQEYLALDVFLTGYENSIADNPDAATLDPQEYAEAEAWYAVFLELPAEILPVYDALLALTDPPPTTTTTTTTTTVPPTTTTTTVPPTTTTTTTVPPTTTTTTVPPTTTTTIPAATVRANAAAAVTTLTQQLQTLSQDATSLVSELQELEAEISEDPSLGAAELSELESAYDTLETEISQVSQQLTTAQSCANNTGTPTAQCVSLYG